MNYIEKLDPSMNWYMCVSEKDLLSPSLISDRHKIRVMPKVISHSAARHKRVENFCAHCSSTLRHVEY